MPASMLHRVSLAALLLLAACGKTEVESVQLGPVTLDDAQKQILARFVGPWQHAGGATEQEAAMAAVRTVTAQMNGLIRGMAESRLEQTVRLDAGLTIEEKDGIVTIARSEQAKPFVAPADGQTFDMQTSDGDDGRGSLRIEGDTLHTHVQTEDGGGERFYRIDAEGTLIISARTFSPRLPGDIEYTATYARP